MNTRLCSGTDCHYTHFEMDGGSLQQHKKRKSENAVIQANPNQNH